MCRPQRTSGITSGPLLPSFCTNLYSLILRCPIFPWVPTLVPFSVLWTIWFLNVCCPLKRQPWRITHLPEMIYQSTPLPHVSCIKYLLDEWTHPQQWRVGDNKYIYPDSPLHFQLYAAIPPPPAALPLFHAIIYSFLHIKTLQSSSLPQVVTGNKTGYCGSLTERWLSTILFILVKKHTASPINSGKLTALLLNLRLALWFALTNRIQVMLCEF